MELFRESRAGGSHAARARIAPADPGAIVGADARLLPKRRPKFGASLDRRRHAACGAGLEDDGRRPAPDALDVEPVAADVDFLPGKRRRSRRLRLRLRLDGRQPSRMAVEAVAVMLLV